jgi:hypothetical protein
MAAKWVTVFATPGRFPMMTGRCLAIVVLLSLVLVSSALAAFRPAPNADASTAGAQMQMDMSGPPDQGIPSYHAYALKPPIPATQNPKQFPDALSRNVYTLAAKIKTVLYQQPCYCYCDRMGHKSLHSCFENTHGAECSICMKELYYAYTQHQNGKTAKQIRQGIIRGDWKHVELHSAAAID